MVAASEAGGYAGIIPFSASEVRVSESGDAANKALNTLEEIAGGRLEIVAQLATVATLGQKETYLAQLLADPRNDEYSLRTLCKQAGCSVREFIVLLRHARFSGQIAEAMDRVAKYIPDVAEDVMARSVPHTAECPTCNGTGTVEASRRDKNTKKIVTETVTCSGCGGRKVVKVLPDLERQKVALEIAGILKRGGGVQVGVQVNTPAPASGAPLTTSPAFRTETDSLLYERPAVADTVDAEPADE